jgi:hypothetical protein
MTRATRGHTLAELACVTGVLLVFLTALFFVLAGARRSGARTDRAAAELQATQVLLARIAADLDSAADVAIADAGELAIGARVTYRFDARTGFVTRNGETVRCGPFERVSFARAGSSVTVTTALEVRIACPHLAPSRLDAYDPRRGRVPARGSIMRS